MNRITATTTFRAIVSTLAITAAGSAAAAPVFPPAHLDAEAHFAAPGEPARVAVQPYYRTQAPAIIDTTVTGIDLAATTSIESFYRAAN